MSEKVTVAGVQMDVTLGQTQQNLDAIVSQLRRTSSQGALLTVFPECALTGYCFENREEALPFAETLPGPASETLAGVCRELDCFVVFGLLERDGDNLFNACVLVGPQGLIGSYRKVHLPYLGVDRFTTPGDRPFAVHQAGPMRVGMHICYDAAFPEAARIMALGGADLLALPTNWPPGAETTACYLINARALENHVYFMAVNRIGSERGFPFIGQSKLCSVDGSILSEASRQDAGIVLGEIDLTLVRNKHIVRVPGKHEIDRFRDRRPEFYGPIADR